MGSVISSDSILSRQALFLLQRLQGGNYWVQLFTNNFTPNPDSLLTDFTQAAMPGYTPIQVTTQFTPIVKQTTGVFQLGNPVFDFGSPTLPGSFIYGWYITNSAEWAFAGVLASPYACLARNHLKIGIQLQELSTSVIIC